MPRYDFDNVPFRGQTGPVRLRPWEKILGVALIVLAGTGCLLIVMLVGKVVFCR